ncbi:MAG: hypothetical protein LH474_08735 [Chamaesiphon sp.]|nr:hypothetical protein [Chamaesiphon sp.]
MEITIIDDSQANIELTDLEIKLIENIFNAIQKYLDHEPEFQTRIGISCAEAQRLIASLSNNGIVDLAEVSFINNIFNEVCNGISIRNFEEVIGIPKVEAKSYLRAFNKLINQMRDRE